MVASLALSWEGPVLALTVSSYSRIRLRITICGFWIYALRGVYCGIRICRFYWVHRFGYTNRGVAFITFSAFICTTSFFLFFQITTRW